jgi:hypothetical protein
MRRRPVAAALLLLLLVGAAMDVDAARPNTRANSRALKRANAKRWRRVAEVSRLKARSAARQFLENAGTVSLLCAAAGNEEQRRAVHEATRDARAAPHRPNHPHPNNTGPVCAH